MFRALGKLSTDYYKDGLRRTCDSIIDIANLSNGESGCRFRVLRKLMYQKLRCYSTRIYIGDIYQLSENKKYSSYVMHNNFRVHRYFIGCEFRVIIHKTLPHISDERLSIIARIQGVAKSSNVSFQRQLLLTIVNRFFSP